MKGVLLVLFAVVLAAGGCLAQEATAGKESASKAKKDEARWHGVIVRHNDEKSTLDVRKGRIEKTVVFDSSTEWSDHSQPADRSAFKDGVDIIALGTWDEKGRLHAKFIDLRHE
jgi:hypothetical protein